MFTYKNSRYFRPRDGAIYDYDRPIPLDRSLGGLTHGVTLAIVFPGTLRTLRKQKEGKILQYGERVWGIERVSQAIEKTEQFFQSLGLSTRLSQEKIGDTTITEIENRFNERNAAFGEAKNVTGSVAREILESCK